MNNPFESIVAKLNSIERSILDLKEKPYQVENFISSEQILNVQEAAKFLNLTVPTIYSKVSKGELPVMKRSKRLYFSNTELIQYIKEGRKMSNQDIDIDADLYLSNSKKGSTNGKY
jgi:excisionase family DNA binding protein